MSNPSEPSDSSKPVVKDKNPHNYRKVGYSMIVISVSLVLIGLLVWAIGDNYHFSGDIMAKQEIDSMTPKNGYAVVLFDYTQPIGAKLKLLDTASNLGAANNLKARYIPQYIDQKAQVLIFDSSVANNTGTISLAEVYAMTPANGYNVVSFNTVMPVGARLAGLKLDATLGEAINDTAKSADLNTDKLVQILTFTSSYDDNLKQVLGSKYDPLLVSENINQIKSLPKKLVLPKATPAPVIANKTAPIVLQNTTKVAISANVTVSANGTKPLVPAAQNNSGASSAVPANALDKMAVTANATATPSAPNSTNHTKTVTLSEKLTVNSTS